MRCTRIMHPFCNGMQCMEFTACLWGCVWDQVRRRGERRAAQVRGRFCLQNCLFTPELQWQPRGKRRFLLGNACCSQRAYDFMCWLARRPERDIAVVRLLQY
jgi:hypothetical protein